MFWWISPQELSVNIWSSDDDDDDVSSSFPKPWAMHSAAAAAQRLEDGTAAFIQHYTHSSSISHCVIATQYSTITHQSRLPCLPLWIISRLISVFSLSCLSLDGCQSKEVIEENIQREDWHSRALPPLAATSQPWHVTFPNLDPGKTNTAWKVIALNVGHIGLISTTISALTLHVCLCSHFSEYVFVMYCNFLFNYVACIYTRSCTPAMRLPYISVGKNAPCCIFFKRTAVIGSLEYINFSRIFVPAAYKKRTDCIWCKWAHSDNGLLSCHLSVSSLCQSLKTVQPAFAVHSCLVIWNRGQNLMEPQTWCDCCAAIAPLKNCVELPPAKHA